MRWASPSSQATAGMDTCCARASVSTAGGEGGASGAGADSAAVAGVGRQQCDTSPAGVRSQWPPLVAVGGVEDALAVNMVTHIYECSVSFNRNACIASESGRSTAKSPNSVRNAGQAAVSSPRRRKKGCSQAHCKAQP